MRQFCVYRNRNKATRSAYPLLLNLQSDLISDTGTRVVVPLVEDGRGFPAMPPLAPRVRVNGKLHVMATPLMAGTDIADLGALEADLSDERELLMSALDFLVSGF